MSKLKMQSIRTLALATLLGVSILYATPYTVNTKNSTVNFEIRNLIVSSVKGTFTIYNGNYDYNLKTKHIKKLEGTAEVSSIFTDNKKRDKHLQASDILNAKKFPTIKFKLIKHNENTALIALTIKGITKQWTFKIAVLSTKNKQNTHITLNGKISRKAYNISINALMEAGGLMIGDEIKINLDLIGTK